MASPDDMRALGRRLAAMLRPGDLVVLNGALGTGKTTLVQGIGAGLGVRGPVTSPTFVIARVHPSLTGGPTLVAKVSPGSSSTGSRLTVAAAAPVTMLVAPGPIEEVQAKVARRLRCLA